MNVSDKHFTSRFESPAGPVTKDDRQKRTGGPNEGTSRVDSISSLSPFKQNLFGNAVNLKEDSKEFEIGPGYSFSKPHFNSAVSLNQNDQDKNSNYAKQETESNVKSADNAIPKNAKAKPAKKRGRPCKVKVETTESVSSDISKSKNGLKRGQKEQNKSTSKSRPIDPKRRERNRTLARESRKRKKEYIQSLEKEISDLKKTVSNLRDELSLTKERNSFNAHSFDPNSVEAKKSLQDEVMKHMENMVNESQLKHNNNDLKDCISLLEANHGVLNNDRKSLIRNNIKTLIDKLLPDFVKCVFVRSDDGVDMGTEELNKMMKCSKYQYKELMKKRNVSDWEKIYLIMNLDKEQREKMFEMKRLAQQSRKTYSKIIKNLLIIKNQIFEELKKTNCMFDNIRSVLSDVQIAKFLLWVKSDGVSNVDRYKLWGLKRSKQSSQSNDDDEPSLTDSEDEEEDKDEGLIKLDPDKTDMDGIKLDDADHHYPSEVPGFGNMLKNFWSKYIYNGFKDIYNKGNKDNQIVGDPDELGNRVFDEYPDFQNEMNLMKDINQEKDYVSDPEFNLSMEIDGLEKLC